MVIARYSGRYARRCLGGQFAPSNKFIAACKEIYDDEFGHMLEGIAWVAKAGRQKNSN